jgi:hypothetical protein
MEDTDVVSNSHDFGNIVIDSKGNPSFIYQTFYPDYSNTTLVYAMWDDAAWKTRTVFFGSRLDSIGYLVLDAHDNPHVTYVTSGPLIYASWTGTKWQTQTVDSNFTDKGPCFLALDSTGSPHISYRTGNVVLVTASIMYATTSELEDFSRQASSLTFAVSSCLALVIAVFMTVLITAIILLLYRRHQKTVKQVIKR